MKRIIKTATSTIAEGRPGAVWGRLRQFRPRVSRRGSVLILVVALLVLLAIIGTAYISTARTDRGASATNSENTEITLLLQGVEDMVNAQIIADVNPVVGSVTKFRTVGTTYTPYNSPLNDPWLSSRVPVIWDATQPVGAVNYNPAVWRGLSAPPGGVFSDPTSSVTLSGDTTSAAGGGVYIPISESVNGTVYPALQAYTPGPPTWHSAMMAADTDNDGIGDAGLFRLPCGEINGVTYYGAYRVIDNAAAVNASVAWAPQQTTPAIPAPTPMTPAYLSAQQTLPGNFWPTNVDMAGLLPDSLTALNTNYRFGTATPSTAPPAGESGLGFAYYAGYPTGNNYDTVWNELGRRLQDPASGYQALMLGDSAAMAHRFVLRDPNASSSNLENYLPISTLNNARTTPYLASDWSTWFSQNFNYSIGAQPSTANLRSTLVAYDPVSCFTQNKYGPLAAPGALYSASTTYTFGDWVTNVDPSGYTHSYVCIEPCIGVAPPTATAAAGVGIPNYYQDSANWVYEPWNDSPVKTSVNTGTFGQLWLAYWNVMCDTQNAAPGLALANSTTQVGTNMFRDSLRYSTGAPGPAAGAPLSATQELQLRAAIAALNTITLRTTGPNTHPPYYGTESETHAAALHNYAASAGPEYTAVAMGTLPQPYITEVYADNDPAVGATGYIAIEVYNPYPYTIQLTGWALATVARPATAGTALSPTVIPSTSTGWNTSGPKIPANGYAVFANTATPANYSGVPTATVANQAAPTAAAPPLYVVSDLTQAFGNDLVLMRPPPGSAAASGSATDITGFFPVDSYDFTGLAAQTPATLVQAATFEWHYVRPQTLPWQFVYPGRFNPAATSPTPRFTDTTTLNVTNTGTITLLPSLTSLGMQDLTASYAGQTIQLNNIDFGGPQKLGLSTAGASTNLFPFGEFARNGDIMQVPFIGSYLIYRGSVAPANLVEMNPVTLDSAYAAGTAGDQTVAATANQYIGRFAPYWGVDYSTANPSGTGTPYGWCTRLLDYLTVQAPGDDYTPNADPVGYLNSTGKSPAAIANASSKVVNAPFNQSNTEDTVALQGLININTASWRVLATLPFSDDPNTNAAIAQAIVNYRDGYYSISSGTYVNGNGPFRTIYDLNNVISQYNYTQTGISSSAVPNISFISTSGSYYTGSPPSQIYANAYNWLAPSHAPTNNDGILTPLYQTFVSNYPSATPYVPVSDFQEQNLALNRVSNLITTRSDSYTVYVLVQGWQNAGTANAKLVVQRRAAYIVDRSGMTPANPTPTITNISTN